MPEKLTEIEFTGVDVAEHRPLISLQVMMNEGNQSIEELTIETNLCPFHISIQGNRAKQPIVTFHDIGLNAATQFHGFFNYSEMNDLMNNFCCYHIDAPGQQEGLDNKLDDNFLLNYPNFDQLSEAVKQVIDRLELRRVVVFGVGAGANILSRFALNYPDRVCAVVLINCVTTKCGWIEWGYQKWSNWYLGAGQVTSFTQNYLLWHHFGYKTLETNHDLINAYSDVLTKGINPNNLAAFIGAYINRTDLGTLREPDPAKKKSTRQFRCPVLNVTGDDSPHLSDVTETNGRLDPENSTFLKLSECGGMVLEEQPGKMAESMLLFLQGLGFVPHMRLKAAPRPSMPIYPLPDPIA